MTLDDVARGGRFGRFLVAVVPFAVVGFAVWAMVHGLLLLLRGDESWRPILWAAVAPLASVVVGIAAQRLLARVIAPASDDEGDSRDDSSFL